MHRFSIAALPTAPRFDYYPRPKEVMMAIAERYCVEADFEATAPILECHGLSF